MFKSVNFLFILLGITINVYSQKEDCTGFPFYLRENNVVYMDSTFVNGIKIYTDSIIVEEIITYTDSTLVNGLLVYTDSNIHLEVKNYPISLINNLPFTSAIYRNDCEFIYLILNSISMMELNKSYFIFSSDKKHVNYAITKDIDTELYAKYNPIKKDNNASISFSINNDKNIIKWIQNEMDKGRIVSFGYKNERRFICKSFDMDSIKIIDKYRSNNYDETQAWAHHQMGKGYKVDINYNKEAKEYIAIIK
ncbi:MAG: hypothetical protein PHC83_08885 [Bacteroidales bacterium]|nr:hypothetical protein [Bacteroidales bacterium]